MRFFFGTDKASGSLASIQILRALAALAVCLSHSVYKALGFSHTDLPPQTGTSILESGVDLFFIISGFIMMFTAASTFHQPRAASSFAMRRLIRIAPPYWFFTSLMVLATLFFPDKLNSASFTVPHAVLSFLFVPHHEPGTIAGIHPILGAGWTLLYEMFFYLVFTFALLFSRRVGIGLIAATFIALFAAARLGLCSPTLTTFGSDSILFEFLLGIGAYYVLTGPWNQLAKSFSLVAFAAGLYGVASLLSVQNERFFAQGLPALALFGIIAPLKIPHKNLALLFVLIGDASYTLYLSHPFAIEIVKQILAKVCAGSTEATWFMTLFVAVCMLAAVSGAILFYLLCEKPTTEFLKKRVRIRPSAVALKAPL